MRDYDPTLGRYLQADPLGLVDGASIYGYALQNPGRYTDPRGEDSDGIVWPTPLPPVFTPGIEEAANAGQAILDWSATYNPIDLIIQKIAAARAPVLPMEIGESCGDGEGVDCEQLYEDDLDVCRALGRTTNRRDKAAICYGIAEQRRWECENLGAPVTPLNVWH